MRLSFVILLIVTSLAVGAQSPRPGADCETCGSGNGEFIDAVGMILEQTPADPNALKTINCDQRMVDLIKQGMDSAKVMNVRLLNDVTGRKAHPAQREFMTTAAEKIKCMARKIVKVEITCADLGGNLGWANPIPIPFKAPGLSLDLAAISKFYVDRRLRETRLNLSDAVGSVIVHELSHLCGANDAAYFDEPTESLLHDGRRSSASTADTYQNWAMWGVCMPGPECAARRRSVRPK